MALLQVTLRGQGGLEDFQGGDPGRERGEQGIEQIGQAGLAETEGGGG
jgi:hypothetical protein